MLHFSVIISFSIMSVMLTRVRMKLAIVHSSLQNKFFSLC